MCSSHICFIWLYKKFINMNRNIKRKIQAHPYPLVSPSPWPYHLVSPWPLFILCFFFVFPIVLVFKALYSCYYDENFHYMHFFKEFICHIPFIGSRIIENSFLDYKSLDEIHYKQSLGNILFLSVLATYISIVLFENYPKIFYPEIDYLLLLALEPVNSIPQPENSNYIFLYYILCCLFMLFRFMLLWLIFHFYFTI